MKDARTELTIQMRVNSDGAIAVSASGSGNRQARSHLLGPRDAPLLLGRLEAFTAGVAQAVQDRRPVDASVHAEACALYDALFQGEMRDVAQRLLETSARGPILVRLMVRDPKLQAVPWEALCEPQTHERFLGTSDRMLLARGVRSKESSETLPVKGTVRVLAIAPLPKAAKALQDLEAALSEPIASGAVAWLPPITGEAASRRHIFAKLRLSHREGPHVIHFIGHGGVDAANKPMLRLADGEDGEEWILAESLASELAASFRGELRLVVLEACEGARPGAFGSAAEVLAEAGAQAVVAHLWPVREEVARRCSHELYSTLTSAERAKGDVVASLTAARRTLLLQSSEAFSPVVYLRSPHGELFDFGSRTLVRTTPAGPWTRPVPVPTRPPASSPAVSVKPRRASEWSLRSRLPVASAAVALPTVVRTAPQPSGMSRHAWVVAVMTVIVTGLSVGVAQLVSWMSGEPRDAPQPFATARTAARPAYVPTPPECYSVKDLPQQCVGQPCQGRFNDYQFSNCDQHEQVLLRCERSRVVVAERCSRGCSTASGNSNDHCK